MPKAGRRYEFAGFTLDLERGVLSNVEGPVQLRPKPFLVLQYLVANAGRVVSKDELFENVWPTVAVTDDSITQSVAEIRRALNDGRGLLVRTITRRGYMFSEAELIEIQDADARPSPSPAAGEVAAPSGLPSIVVLPFTNLSDQREQEYYADGIVEDITIALGRFPRIFVIARNSAFTYKGRSVDIREIGRELGVRYVLEGSMRRAGERLRVTVELVEVETGFQLWADRMDGSVADVFEFQDKVVASVIGAIAPRVLEAEIGRARRKRPESLDAYDLYLRALPAVRAMRREDNDLALDLVRQALTLDPNYAVMAGLGAWAYTLRIAQDWPVDRDQDRRIGRDLARRAIAAGQDDPEALATAGYALGFLGEQLQDGLNAVERALSLNPNSALGHANAGWLKAYLGRTREAVDDLTEAIRLSPREPTNFRVQTALSLAHLLNGELKLAVEAGRRAVDANPRFAPALRALAAALAHFGRLEESREVIAQLLELAPQLTITSFAEQSLFRYSGKLSVILDGLRVAGLPE